MVLFILIVGLVIGMIVYFAIQGPKNRRREYLSQYVDYSVKGASDFVERILSDEECATAVDERIIRHHERAESNALWISYAEFTEQCKVYKRLLRKVYDQSWFDPEFRVGSDPNLTTARYADSGVTEKGFFLMLSRAFENCVLPENEELDKLDAAIACLNEFRDPELDQRKKRYGNNCAINEFLLIGMLCYFHGPDMRRYCWGQLANEFLNLNLTFNGGWPDGDPLLAANNSTLMYTIRLATKQSNEQWNFFQRENEDIGQLAMRIINSIPLLKPRSAWSEDETKLAEENRRLAYEYWTRRKMGKEEEWKTLFKNRCEKCKWTAVSVVCFDLDKLSCRSFMHQETDLNSDVAYTEPKKAEPEKTELSKKEKIAKMLEDAYSLPAKLGLYDGKEVDEDGFLVEDLLEEDGFGLEDQQWCDDEDEEEEDEFGPYDEFYVSDEDEEDEDDFWP